MNSKLKKIFGGLMLTAAFIGLTYGAYAQSTVKEEAGPNGCIVNPDNLRGACMKSVEDVWSCIANTEPMDCTSSD